MRKRPIDILVTDAEVRAGLAVIRALGSRGVAVLAVGSKAKSPGFVSRYAAEHRQLPSPYLHPRAFALAVRDLVRERQIPLVAPIQDHALRALDQFRSEFDGLARLAIAPSDALRIVFDKGRTGEVASELGVPMPETIEPASIADALKFSEEVGFPVVMKPRAVRGVLPVDLPRQFKVEYARNRAELELMLQPFAEAGVFPLLQKYYSGHKVQHGVLVCGGRLVGLYQYRAAREFPLTGGQTCLHVSTAVDPELREWSEAMLRGVGWEGVAEVEYRVDEQRGSKVLLEINGRYWAPLSAANKLGLNFPYALYQYLTEGKCETVFGPYPVGKRNMYLRGELIALGLLLAGKTPSGLAPLPSKARAIFDLLRDLRPGRRSPDDNTVADCRYSGGETTMRFIVLVKANKESEAGAMPSEEVLAAMGKYNEELADAGVLLAGEGLHPSSKGFRVRFSGKDRTVTDGPFAETKELVAGFWLWQVGSKEEAMEWIKRCPFQGGEVEVRQVFDADDFGSELTPELREREERLRARVAAKQ